MNFIINNNTSKIKYKSFIFQSNDILQNIIKNLDNWTHVFNMKIVSKQIASFFFKGFFDIFCTNFIKEYSNEKEIIKLLMLFPRLRNLNLGGNYICNRYSINNELINHLDQLYSLEFYYNKNILKNLDIKLINLKSLTITGDNSINDNILSNFPNLEYLYLPSNEIVSDIGIQKLRKLKHLNLENNTKITDTSINKLVLLKTLILDRNLNLTNTGINNLKNLENLSIYWNNNITYQAFENIDIIYLKIRKNIFDFLINTNVFNRCLKIQQIRNIKELYISDEDDITDTDIQILKNLEVLTLEKNNKITDKSIIELVFLKTLNLFTNNLITDFGITYTKHLQRIFMQRNNIITKAVLDNLPNLLVIHVKNFQYFEKNYYERKLLIQKHPFPSSTGRTYFNLQ